MIRGRVDIKTETTVSYENHFQSSGGDISVDADYREGRFNAYLRKADGCHSSSMPLEESDIPQLVELLQDFHKFIEMHSKSTEKERF